MVFKIFDEFNLWEAYQNPRKGLQALRITVTKSLCSSYAHTQVFAQSLGILIKHKLLTNMLPASPAY